MTDRHPHGENTFIALASIAAELHSVMQIAWGVSLAAKNAKVISAQSGDKGRGFQPITNFIDEISQQAMQGVQDINTEAMRLTRIAVYEQQSIDAYRRFDSVRTKNAHARHIKSMNMAMEQVEKNMRESVHKFKKSMSNLNMLLESMDECMLSAKAVASVSRIVTSNAGEYRDKLKIVADELDEATNTIKEKLMES